MAKKITPVHAGEILKEEFIIHLGVTEYRCAKDIGVPPRRINEIVHGTRAMTADTALRLGAYFNVSPQFWMNLQTQFELVIAQEELAPLLINATRALVPASALSR